MDNKKLFLDFRKSFFVSCHDCHRQEVGICLVFPKAPRRNAYYIPVIPVSLARKTGEAGEAGETGRKTR